MKVRDAFKDPDFSPFTREVVAVGELLEDAGYTLENEYYSQGEQTFNFRKGKFLVHVNFQEED